MLGGESTSFKEFQPLDEFPTCNCREASPSKEEYVVANSVSLMTCGLAALYATIHQRATRHPTLANSALVDSSCQYSFPRGYWSTPDGNLNLSNLSSLPFLARRFKPLSIIGEGTFGQIISAQDTFDPFERIVAIKILNRRFSALGRREASCLARIHKQQTNPSIIKVLLMFQYVGHLCMVMELADCSLFHTSFLGTPLRNGLRLWSPLRSEVLRSQSREAPRVPHTPLNVLRHIALQIVSGLIALERVDVIHADLKLENILVISRSQKDGQDDVTALFSPPFRVSLADFGNAIHLSETSAYFESYEIQTISYRAPEVVFGVPFGQAIDMWSFGVILVELYLGRPFIRCSDVLQVAQEMTSQLGPIPQNLFPNAQYPERLMHQHVEQPLRRTDRYGDHYRHVYELLRTQTTPNDAIFVNFICRLLAFNPDERLTPEEALFHPFIQPVFPFTATIGARLGFAENLSMLPKEVLPSPLVGKTTGENSNEPPLESSSQSQLQGPTEQISTAQGESFQPQCRRRASPVIKLERRHSRKKPLVLLKRKHSQLHAEGNEDDEESVLLLPA